MLEKIDEAKSEQEKEENAFGRSRVPTPLENPDSSDVATEEKRAQQNVTAGSAETVDDVVETTNAEKPGKPWFKRRAVLVAASIIFLVGAIVGLRYWLYARSHESTDDAFIDGHIIQISPKVSAYVAKVYVDDNQQVKAGDLIVELDARDYRAQLEQAKAAMDAALARHNEALRNVLLTRATGAASIQRASATVRQARSSVESSRAAAASSRDKAAQATSAVSTAQANLEQARAQVVAAAAEVTRSSADVQRYQELFSKDEVSNQQLDQAVAAARTAAAQLDAAQQRVAAMAAQLNESRSAETAALETARQTETQIAGSQAGVGEAQGRLAQAQTAPEQVAVSQAQAETAGATTEQLRAQLEQAELELSYTKIYATEDGRVTRKSVEEGALVQIGQPLLAIVPRNVWVTANFKENQIGGMVPGQPVDISVDAYPDKVFKAHVDSIQSGTGARFSLIPPENATGNYVKVVQRVPVKIVFDEPADPKHMLAPGMSVVPEVAVR